MPFDAINQVEILTLGRLSWLLRHQEAWPDGFAWNFGRCKSCAIGLAYRLIEGEMAADEFNPNDAFVWLPRAFPALTTEEGFLVGGAEDVFFGDLAFKLRKPVEHVTPFDVADALDALLARQQARAR